MPVIGIPVHMLLERIRTKLEPEALVEHLQHLGCDVEGYATVRRFRCRRCENIAEITETENPPVACDRCGADFREAPEDQEELGESEVIRMELLAVRPDMFDPGGLARVLRNYFEETLEPARYQVAAPRYTVTVDPGMASPESFRPVIACAVLRGVTLDEDRIKVLMKLQENLHWALGRDRKRASIGVYDLDTLQGSEFRYRPVGPEEIDFVPLGWDRAVTPRAVLDEHPKGVAYARLLSGFSRYPLLEDAAGGVLSLPPIINSEGTRVTSCTCNFFVDVTGTEERIVGKALNTLVTSLLELIPGAELEGVRIRYADREVETPDLSHQEAWLDPGHATRRIGFSGTRADVVKLLKRMGHGVEDLGGGPLRVLVPAYRNDILHEVDLVEDVAIAYGYHNLVPALVKTMTVGEELPVERLSGVARKALAGLGYLEVLTLILSSEEVQYRRLRMPSRDDFVDLENPISVEQTLVRTWLVPGLLDTFSVNTDQELPQRLFEVGNVSFARPEAETGAVEVRRVAAGAVGPRVDYAEIRSTCEALLREFGWTLAVAPDDSPSFIPGRGARVTAVRGEERREVGLMGELHPEVLEAFRLVQPAAVLEIDLEALA